MAREVARELAGKAVFVQVNTREYPRAADRMGVQGIPAFFALQGGTVVARTAGAQPKEQLVRWFLDAVK